MARPKAITKLSETPPEGKKNWLIYCGSGIGKTVLAGTAPKGLFLTTEAAGTESAKAFGSDADEWIVNSWEEFGDAYAWLKKEGHKEYDWVIPDSITELEELCWADQLESVGKEFEARIQDYGIVDRKIKKMVDSFHRLPINVLWTAQEMAFTTEDSDGDEIVKVLPKIGRTKGGAPLANLICGKVTLVGYLGITETKEEGEFRRLVVAGGEGWVAKDRHDAFGKYIDNPHIGEMAEAVTARQASNVKSDSKAPKKNKKEKVAA
jgi:phage nucleotide-binding protein